MKFYFHKTPQFIKSLYPGLHWDFKTQSTNEVYLTFDDGPHPEATPFVTELLRSYNFRATFFCIGSNAKKYPDMIQELVSNRHHIGNHTYSHLNGWKSSTNKYIENTLRCDTTLPQINNLKLFRPPYGKATKPQLKALKKDYRIIMWDFMIGDFDNDLNAERSLQLAIKNIKPGSIVVFHDSFKAFKNLKYLLPKYLDAIRQKGLVSDAITADLF